MNILDSDIRINEAPGEPCPKLAAAAACNEVNNLFDMLEQAEHEHHDALVQVKGEPGRQKAQFKLLQGGACLFKTAPGKA